jgi:hypothetical protein
MGGAVHLVFGDHWQYSISMITQSFLATLDRETVAYLLLAGIACTAAIVATRGIKAHRLELRRRAGTGPRSQFEKRRRR